MGKDGKSETCHVILQWFDDDSGWGPAAIAIPGTLLDVPCPFVYTGTDQPTIEKFKGIAEAIHKKTGRPTRLVRYETRVDLLVLD